MTNKNWRVDLPSGTFAVRFISVYRNESDYGVTRCGSCSNREARVTVLADGAFYANFKHEFQKEYGMTYAEAESAVRVFMAEKFDSDVREIVRMGIMEHADDSVRVRAQQLGLIPA